MVNETHEKFKVKGEDLLKKVKEIIHESNVRRVIIKNEKGRTFMEIPLSVGVVGTLAAPILVGVGAIAAMAMSFTIEVVKKGSPKKTTIKAVTKKKTTKKPQRKAKK